MKSTILIMCYRAFDIRLLISTGIVEILAQKHSLVLLTPEELFPQIKDDIHGEITLEEIKYHNPKFDKASKSRRSLRQFLDTTIQKVLYYTYGKDGNKKHLTQDFLTKFYLEEAHGVKKLFRITIVLLSKTASRFKLFRKLLQTLGCWFNTPKLHQDILKKHQPSLIVVCSLGLSLDALLTREAKKAKIPVVSIVQSWDKTSSKGYPLISPDYVVVWSHIMAKETQIYHDMSKEKIYVGGVPQWDYYFNKGQECSKEEFYLKYNLDSKNKIIFFSLCSMAYHRGNLETIEFLYQCLQQEKFSQQVQLILRPHPAYYGGLEEAFSKQKQEFLDFIAPIVKDPRIFLIPPKIIEGKYSYISVQDNWILKELLMYADICVSVLSTQMIEAAIFNKPIVSLQYGAWDGNEFKTPVEKYKVEHLERVFKVGAIALSKTPQELLLNINSALNQPQDLVEKRVALMDQEIPINRGNAAKKIAEYISSL